jgi:hypothetical protein
MISSYSCWISSNLLWASSQKMIEKESKSLPIMIAVYCTVLLVHATQYKYVIWS